MSATAKIHTAIRIPAEDFNEIRRQADERGITFTQMLVDGALDRLRPDETVQHQVDELARRIQRLEELAYG